MCKFLFCDMDGTLIDDNQEIHPKNIELMREWQKHNHKIVLCTGRNIIECKTVLNKFDFPYDYLILNNGGHILDKSHTLFEEKINHNIGCAILDFTTKFHGMWSFYCDGKETYGYLNGKTYDHSGYGNMEIDRDFIEMYHNAGDFQIIWFNQDNHQMDTTTYCLDYIRKHMPSKFQSYVNQYFVDIVPLECSKGEGIRKLLSLIDDDVDAVYSIGDSYNDISMFKASHHSATFQYADEYVKNYAKKIVNYVYEFLEDGLEE